MLPAIYCSPMLLLTLLSNTQYRQGPPSQLLSRNGTNWLAHQCLISHEGMDSAALQMPVAAISILSVDFTMVKAYVAPPSIKMPLKLKRSQSVIAWGIKDQPEVVLIEDMTKDPR